MGRMLVQIKDRYFEWSTVVDAPVTYGMTLPQLRHYIKEEYGRQGLEELPKRLERCAERGHSAQGDNSSLASFLACNRAGPKESCLSAAAIYKQYAYDEKALGPLPELGDES